MRGAGAKSRRWVAWYAAVGVAVSGALSCSDGTGLVVGPPAVVLLVAGDNQSGVVGKELATPLRVKVLDADGNPVPGQVVNFRVVSGGGSVFAGVAITTDSGTAIDRWTLGTRVADPQRVEARAIDQNTGQALVFGTFEATPNPDVPAQLTIVEGDQQTAVAGAELPVALAVGVSDQHGNAVPSVAVAWTVTAGGGTLGAPTSETDAHGIARVSWRSGTVAGSPQQVSAMVGTLTPVVFSATTSAGPPAQLILHTAAAGAVVNVPFVSQPAVRIADVNGNTSPTAGSVSLSVGAGASIIGNHTAIAASGVATFSGAGLNGPVGTYTLTYSATLDDVPRSVTQTLDLVAGPPAKYVLTMVGNPRVAGTVTISAQLSDANGAPVAVAGHNVTWAADGVGGTFGSATSATDASGIATVTFTAGTVAGAATVSATDVTGRHGAVSLSIAPGPPEKLAFVNQPANAGWKTIIAPAIQVAVRDQYGNTITESTDRIFLTVSTNPGGANLAGGEEREVVNGIATFFAAILDQPGSGYRLRANSLGNLSSDPSDPFDVSRVAIVATIPGSSDRERSPVSIAVAAGKVYFASGPSSSPSSLRGGGPGYLWSVPVSGGAPVQHSSSPQSSFHFYGWAGRMVADDTHLYVLNTASRVERVSLDGGPTVRVVESGRFAEGLALAAGSVFLNHGILVEFSGTNVSGDLGVARVNLSNAQRTTLYSRSVHLGLDIRSCAPPSMLVHDGWVYYTAYDRPTTVPFNQCPAPVAIERVPVDGGAYEVLVSVNSRSHMATDGTRLYYAQDGELRSIPLGGGASAVHLAGLQGIGRMVVSDNHLYVTSAGSVQRYRLGDFAHTTIVANDGAGDIAVDDVAVYWTSGATLTPSIKKAPK